MRTVIIGNGGAAVESVFALRGGGNNAEIHLFSDSTFPALNPTLLTYYIAGKIGLEGLFPFDGDIFRRCDVKLHLGSRVTQLDAVNKTVENDANVKMSYDNCIVCSGARPVIPQRYQDKEIFTIRSAQDAISLKKQISEGKKALVVGASMVGIKVVEALADNGVEVTLTDTQDHVFPLTSNARCSSLIEKRLLELGIHLELATDNPDLSRYDIIVVCVGVTPNIDFIDKTQIDIYDGILTDRFMQTSCKGVYAAGDCARIRAAGSESLAPGLWASARYMGRTAGNNIAGKNEACFEVVRHNSTRFFDMDFSSIGDISQGDDIFEMESRGKYCMISWKEDQIMGINLLNMPEISGIIKSQTIKSQGLSAITMGKVFGRYPRIREAFLERGA